MKRDSFAYRFCVLLIVYLFLASVLIASLASVGTVPPLVLWIVGGTSLLLFAGIVVVNEIIIRKKKKK
ncbi:MAG: hypothetical protein MJ228_00560 [Bacilli bacterium]|nr:hypothetical protein [Bacilli bacterium]